MKTRGLFARSFMDFELREFELPALGDNDALVKVHACGVCGTDVHFARDAEGEYNALGHEIAAEVTGVGRNVTNVKVGDRVIIEDVGMCGMCVNCKNGDPHLCRRMHELEGRPGMAEYMVVHERLCDPFEGLDYLLACLTEPQAVSLSAVLHADIPLAGDVVVFGPGPLGIMCVRLAKLRGAAAVGLVGYEAGRPMEKARLEVGRKLGADFVVDSAAEDAVEAVHKHFPEGADRVIVTSPPQSMEVAIETGRFGETVSFIGIHLGGKSSITVDVNELVFNKRTLTPTFAEPAIKFPMSLKLLQKGMMPAQDIISHTFRLEDYEATFKGIVEADQPIIKAVCTPHG
ncbi:MAG: alcohol dehydrogenase catalytic domain-containing protein [Candidatus Brocadiia bacterium]|jgi:L-iditol 2-dehydrogenase|nr:alcohol dehydrogenase catalytic domain-containing protein [Candidatus Brocadiia bacterium]